MFGRHRTPSARPSLFTFRIDRPIGRISSSLALYRVPRCGSLWRRDRNRMDSYRVSIADVPEFPISGGKRGPWQQKRCDSLHYHEEWWGSVPPNASRSPWKYFCVLRLRATSIFIQGHCSSFVNMVLGRSHCLYESQRSTHCSRLTEYCRRWLH